MRGSRLIGAVTAVLATVGTVLLIRRRSDLGQARADLYFSDGSMLSLGADAPEIDALLRAAQGVAGVVE